MSGSKTVHVEGDNKELKLSLNENVNEFQIKHTGRCFIITLHR